MPLPQDSESDHDLAMTKSSELTGSGHSRTRGLFRGKAVDIDDDFEGDEVHLSHSGSESSPLLPSALKADITDWFPARYVLCMMGSLGFVLVYCLRVTVSVGVAAMVNSSYTPSRDVNGSGVYCSDPNANGSEEVEAYGEFNWDSHIQELILAGFFYGYVFTQLPGGWLSDKFGGKYLFAAGVLCTSLCSLAFPLAAYVGVPLLFALRVLSGLGEGITFPAMYSMFSRWVHPEERSRIAVFTFTGSCFGNVIGQVVSGATSSSDFLGGWPASFYIFGTIGVIWFAAWLFLAFDTPAKHPRISLAERKYIESGYQTLSRTESVKVPWGSILSSIHVWAIVVAHMAATWAYFTLLTNLPIYMSDVLRFNLTLTGVFSAVPYVMQFFTMVFTGMLSDHFINTNTLSITTVRKLFTCVGLTGYGLTQIFVALSGCNGAGAIFSLSLGMGFAGMAFASYLANTLDLAPPYSGSIGGLVQTAGPISGILGPFLVGVLTEDQNDLLGWQKVFYIAFGVLVFGAISFLLFGSGKEQSWSKIGGGKPSYDQI